MRASPRRAVLRAVVVLCAVALAVDVALAVGDPRLRSVDSTLAPSLYRALVGAAAIACLLRAARIPAGRAGWA